MQNNNFFEFIDNSFFKHMFFDNYLNDIGGFPLNSLCNFALIEYYKKIGFNNDNYIKLVNNLGENNFDDIVANIALEKNTNDVIINDDLRHICKKYDDVYNELIKLNDNYYSFKQNAEKNLIDNAKNQLISFIKRNNKILLLSGTSGHAINIVIEYIDNGYVDIDVKNVNVYIINSGLGLNYHTNHKKIVDHMKTNNYNDNYLNKIITQSNFDQTNDEGSIIIKISKIEIDNLCKLLRYINFMKKSDKDKEKHFDSLTHVNNKIIQNIVNNESKKKFDGKKISEILVNEELIKIIHENGQKNLLYNIIIDEK